MNGADPFVVLTADFAPYLNAYITEHQAEADNHGAGRQYADKAALKMAGPIEVLSAESTIKPRRLLDMRKPDVQMSITFNSFDKIICAMGRPELALQIPVYRNPRYSRERFLALLERQGLKPEDVNVNVELACPVPWAVAS